MLIGSKNVAILIDLKNSYMILNFSWDTRDVMNGHLD